MQQSEAWALEGKLSALSVNVWPGGGLICCDNLYRLGRAVGKTLSESLVLDENCWSFIPSVVGI